MTEEEAKTKVCCGPLAVGAAVVLTGAAMAGAPVGSDGPSNCIGSACMAWREARIGRVRVGGEYQAFTTVGFCGLAGRPE